jgi:capsid assembly protease
MDRISHILSYVLSTPWAIRPEMAAIIQDILAARRSGVRFTAEEISARIGAAPPRPAAQGGVTVAVIPIVGVICHRMELVQDVSSSGISPASIASAFRAAMNDPAIGAIVLDIDSPGGTVFGLAELGDEIRAARGKKTVVAVANGIAASAAYWLGSQAEQFVVTPSGQVGSIGVLSMHEDWAKALEDAGVKVTLVHFGKYKVEGNPFEPLGDEAKAAVQADVDAYGAMFHKAVARGRGVSIDTVRTEFGQGRMVMAAEAAKRGMVDAVETFDQVIARLANPKRSAAGAAALDVTPAVAAEAPAAPAVDAAAAELNVDYIRSRVAMRACVGAGAEHGVDA